MMSYHEALTICGTSPGENMLHLLRDKTSGRWLGVKSSRENLATDAEFERLYSLVYPGRTFGQAPRTYVAIVDSGVMHAHPNMAGRILADVDFTGEGPEDRNGHGTVVSLVFMRGFKTPLSLLNVKVIGAGGRADPKLLLRGMTWLRKWIAANPEQRLHINMSVGAIRRRVLGPDGCDGSCGICRGAIELAESGAAMISIAAGNRGVTECPASAAFKHPAISAVTAVDIPRPGYGTAAYKSRTFFEPI